MGFYSLAFPVQRFNFNRRGFNHPELKRKGRLQEVKVNYADATLPREKTGHDPR